MLSKQLEIAAHRIFLCVAVLWVGGCTMPLGTKFNPISISQQFDAGQARSLLIKGKNTVRGVASVTTEDGEVISCAKWSVELIPATGYAREVLLALYGNRNGGFVTFSEHAKYIDPDVPEYRELSLKTKCNADGMFIFEDVADGEFIVKPMAGWKQSLDGFPNYIGGIFAQPVVLKGGEVRMLNFNAQVNIVSLKGKVKPSPIRDN